MKAFDQLNLQNDSIEIDGISWQPRFWDTSCIRQLTASTDRAHFTLKELGSDGQVRLEVNWPSRPTFGQTYQTIDDAANWAATFEWVDVECAGVTWTVTSKADFEVHGTSYKFRKLAAQLGVSDLAEITHYEDGHFAICRTIDNDRVGRFELYYSCSGDAPPIRTFEEAVAVVLSMPTFIHALAAQPNPSKDKGVVSRTK